MNERHIEENELHAYVDGALAPERRAVVEAYLAANPEAARRIETYRAQNALLRGALDPMLSEPVPPSLRVRPRARSREWFRYGGMAASLLLAGAVGWFARGQTPAAPTEFGTALAQRAVLAHLVYAPEVQHPVEVSARQEQHLVQWLSKRMRVPMRAPHLAGAGFQLVGGRLLPGDAAQPAAQFMYENTEGRRLTLYVAANADDPRETAFRYAEDGDISTFYWIEGQLGYALSGELTREQLLPVAQAVYHELSR